MVHLSPASWYELSVVDVPFPLVAKQLIEAMNS